MPDKLNWGKINKEFDEDVQKIKNASIDIKRYRKRKTSSKEDIENINKTLKKDIA